MDVEDRRRYFIVGSVFFEIVLPLFRTRLENEYRSKGQGSLQAFLSIQPVIHILFHLRHRNASCCKDNLSCFNKSNFPLIYCQWTLLYTEIPGQPGHNCHCKFIANPVQLCELDITLASLILLNCCHLQPSEENAVRKLRRYKNDYLSHNTEGQITETEYKSLWTDLTSFVLQLDPNKQDDLIRIENRPLDEGLCMRCSIERLNIHKKLNEMDTRIQGIDSAVQELLSYHRNEIICQYCKKKLIEQDIDESKISPYKLGQNIFYPHHQINLKSEFSTLLPRATLDVVMMDDGRLVLCSCFQFRLLICNTDGSEIAAIPVDADGSSLTAVNNSTVVVIVNQPLSNPRIELYDINNKHKIKSISLYGFEDTFGMTMINDNLVVGADRELLIIDYQTGEILKSIGTHCHPWGITVSGNRIFFGEEMENNLYWYSFTDDKIHTLTLPSIQYPMTTL
ncbi:unnamed protein product [Mytilus coruscus]|uniref:DZIP3-like HEPN domain-containing protein n=1 Tax=Mytilus coruscus TaxID=42192 RepID=A0A6J8DKC4_MYTCO|nr:unnamed protein product [Mytilus coruscus]